MPAVTVVLPTKNEAQNIRHVLTRISEALDGAEATVLVVDDASVDGTIAEALATAGDLVKSITIRTWDHAAERPKGLSQSIMDGIRRADSPLVVVCDADGQHAYERIPALIAAAEASGLAIGARLDRSHNRTPWHRQVLARLGRFAAYGPAPRTEDPMSGFFCVDRQRVHIQDPEFPLGYKALAEILTWNPEVRCVDVAATLQPRHAGRSKVTPAVVWNSLRQAWCVRS